MSVESKKLLEETEHEIISEFETAWLRRMLDDKVILKEMGLRTNLTSKEKDELVATIIAQGDEYLNNSFDTVEKPYDVMKTPSQNFLEEALENMDMENTTTETEQEILSSDLVVGEKYKIHFPIGMHAIVKLNRIIPNSFGDDYIFENISGAEELVGTSTLKYNEFPLPKQLVLKTKFTLLN